LIWIFTASLVVTMLGLGSSLALLRRSGDLRVALLCGVFVALGVGQGVLAAGALRAPLAWDASLAIACAGLAASVLGWLSVGAVGRTLAELDRSETLHWSSMEGVRALAELSGERGLSAEERVARLLEIGSRCFGLEVGIVSRVAGSRYEVTTLRAPGDFPIVAGAALPLEETLCRLAFESDRPVALSSGDGRDGSGLRGALPFQAYLGVALGEGGRPTGTLAFGSLEPRPERFTASEKDLVLLMARWLEMEREERAGVAPRAPSAPAEAHPPAPRSDPAPPVSPAPSATPAPPVNPAPDAGDAAAPLAPWVGVRPLRRRVVELNAIARSVAARLEEELGEGVGLHLDLETALPPAVDLRIPLEAIVQSLVRHAAAGLSGGGEIFIETRSLEAESETPSLVPSHAPDRYLTLSVHDTGGGGDADSLATLFDDPQDPDAPGAASQRGPLRLSTVYRMLQRCGGDLSVAVEPGQGTSLTIFLPRADAASERRAAGGPAVAPGPSA